MNVFHALVITGMKEHLLNSYWVWRIPFGYKGLNKGKANQRHLVVNEQGKLLKSAFEWKVYKQLPNAEIARHLSRLGLNINEKRLNEIFLNPF